MQNVPLLRELIPLVVFALGVAFGITSLCVFWRKIRREKAELEAVGREMIARLHEQLVAVSPHIARSLKFASGVNRHSWGRWFWQKRRRVEITIYLSAAENLRSVRTTAEEFVRDYAAEPGRRNCEIKLTFGLLPRAVEGGE